MKTKTRIFTLISLFTIFGISSITCNYFNLNLMVNNNEKTNPKNLKKAYYNNSLDPIFIDDKGVNNWTWARNQAWCPIGDGSWNNPYLIENVTINSKNLASCIEIKNSIVHFKIKNCTVYNSILGVYDAGIKLYNVTNGILISNNCSNNNGDGISLNYCNNTEISNNIVNNNKADGIFIQSNYDDNNITITNNTINYNSNNGIYIGGSNKNVISNNNVKNNSVSGFELRYSYYNNVTRNNLLNNSANGIRIYYSNYNNFSKNTANHNGVGISIAYSNRNNISWNEARFDNYGIYLEKSNYSTISFNYLTNNYYDPIFEFDSTNFIRNNFYSNTFYLDPFVIDDLGYGNYTWAQASDQEWWCSGSGSFNKPYLIKNVIINGYNTSSCIEIQNSNVYFKIENCTTYNSNIGSLDAGIALNNVSNGILKNNTCSNNRGYGISLNECNYTSILGNIIQYNKFGINIQDCYENNISGNTVDNNIGSGIRLHNSNKRILVINNEVNLNNQDGILLQGDSVGFINNNSIIGNIISKNKRHGIHIMGYSYNNTFKNNQLFESGLYINWTMSYEKNFFQHNIDSSNKINGKDIIYYIDESPLGSDNFTNAGQVILVNCNDSIISDLNLSHGSVGLSLIYCNNITVLNIISSYNHYHGIELYESNKINLSGNVVKFDKDIGIFIYRCENITLTGNNMTRCGLYFFPKTEESFYSLIIDSTNYVNDKYLYYYIEKNSLNSINFIDAGQIILYNCNDSLISNLDLSFGSLGILMFFCNNNTISNVTSSYNNEHGLYLINCQDSRIKRNNFNNNGKDGIYAYYLSINNNITENVITNNSGTGIKLTYYSDYSNIYYNNIAGNAINAIDDGGNNNWDDGEVGNYWGDYSGSDSSPLDGIGDSSYSIPGYAIDNDTKPLMYPIYGDLDGDGLSNIEEYIKGTDGYQTNISNPDSDYDGLTDYWEAYYGTNPWLNDTDGDNMPDLWETENLLDATVFNAWDDADNDLLLNYYEFLNGTDPQDNDTDNDFVLDYDEIIGTLGYKTNATNPDTDLDGLIDGYEYGNYTNPLDPDTDNDLLLDGEELILGVDGYITNATNPDSDGDMLTDYYEWGNSTNPWNPDTDSDNMPDGWEVFNLLDPLSSLDNMSDPDLDLLLNVYEYSNGTDPQNDDTDSDNMPDGWEVFNLLDPLSDLDKMSDPDLDLLLNVYEYSNGTDPHNDDTDGDNFNDYKEIVQYNTDPTDSSWYPMPNLFVAAFSVNDVYEGQSFILNFTITNNGIWKAEDIIIIIRCETLNLTFYNNTNSPFNLAVNQSRNFLIDYSGLTTVGSYVLTLEIDPDNLINEQYSNEDGTLRTNGEDDNRADIEMRIISLKGGNGDLITLIIIIGSIIAGVFIGAVGIFFIAKPRVNKFRYAKKQKLKASLELEDFENRIRDFITRKLQDYYDYEWWEKGIPENIRISIEQRIKAERKFMPKMKSQRKELLELNHFYPIISETKNWDEAFSEVFPDKKKLREDFEDLIEFKNKLSQNVATTEEINNYPLFIHGILNFITKGFNIFLSYSTKDSDYFHVPVIVNRLKDYPNIEKVLYWEADSGEDIVKYMERALRISKVFILFCSEKSAKSRAVTDEWEAAFQLRKKGLMKIIPVYVNEQDIPYLLSPLLNVQYDENDFEGFIEKLHEEIMRH